MRELILNQIEKYLLVKLNIEQKQEILQLLEKIGEDIYKMNSVPKIVLL